MSKKEEAPKEVLPPNHLRVQGRLVVVKEAFPMPENKDLIAIMNATDVTDMTTFPPLLARVIERMDGIEQPGDPESYKALDALTLFPLFRSVDRHLYARMWGDPKN